MAAADGASIIMLSAVLSARPSPPIALPPLLAAMGVALPPASRGCSAQPLIVAAAAAAGSIGAAECCSALRAAQSNVRNYYMQFEASQMAAMGLLPPGGAAMPMPPGYGMMPPHAHAAVAALHSTLPPRQPGLAPRDAPPGALGGRLLSAKGLRALALNAARSEFAQAIAAAHPSMRASAANLAHYLALRRVDQRPLQMQLQSLGLSSLAPPPPPPAAAAAIAAAGVAAGWPAGAPPPPGAEPRAAGGPTAAAALLPLPATRVAWCVLVVLGSAEEVFGREGVGVGVLLGVGF
jgi:hypothetical protein